LGEHQLDKLGVTGSSPVPPTIESPAPAGFSIVVAVQSGIHRRAIGNSIWQAEERESVSDSWVGSKEQQTSGVARFLVDMANAEETPLADRLTEYANSVVADHEAPYFHTRLDDEQDGSSVLILSTVGIDLLRVTAVVDSTAKLSRRSTGPLLGISCDETVVVYGTGGTRVSMRIWHAEIGSEIDIDPATSAESETYAPLFAMLRRWARATDLPTQPEIMG